VNKKILATMCALFILASASPIFAHDASKKSACSHDAKNKTAMFAHKDINKSAIFAHNNTNKTAVLTDKQLAKLNTTQTKLTDLVTKIESLKTQYGNTTKGKGLLKALNITEKQANKLNNSITAYKANPTKPVRAKIMAFQHKSYELQWKVALIEKILKKLAKKQATNTTSS